MENLFKSMSGMTQRESLESKMHAERGERGENELLAVMSRY